MLYAVRGNREFSIADDEKNQYLDAGFDIYKLDAKGNPKLVKGADTDRVSQLEKELKAAKAELAEAREVNAEGPVTDKPIENPEAK